jgi:sigma-E factor negative regulatory protein RseB
LCLVATTPGFADSDNAMDWLQDMKMSMQELSYRGRFVYQSGNQLESMLLVHVNDEQGARERLVSLNGEARQILRNDQSLTCIWPSSKQVVVDQANTTRISPIWIPDDIKRLSRFYRFDMEGHDRVAGRAAVIIRIEPRDAYRYGMHLWLDQETGLLLQSSVIDENGAVVERVMFTEIQLLDEAERSKQVFTPSIDSSYTLMRSHDDAEFATQQQTDIRWQIQFVPGGFWLESSFLKKMLSSGLQTRHMVFTDGMASVSVFIEPHEDSEHLSGESSMGAVNAFSVDHAEHTITAIGEVPAITVREIASSATYQE